jgi:sterol desaturase/sphingolipid hydroxylase (fatty acid hydroxylase superfamily)
MDEIWFHYGLLHEKDIRLYCYLVFFGILAFWEWKAARRVQRITRPDRWPHNLALTVLNVLVIRVLFPGEALWAAYWARNHNLGLFNAAPVPFTYEVCFTVIFLDWVVYYLHRSFHALPWLWKFHRMHHTDLEVDVTTGTRFHPAEVVIAMLVKSFFIILLGASPAGVLAFEVAFNANSLFEHSNISLARLPERFLRLGLVTPEMHRIHHSALPEEYGRNFGFIFSWWDRFLGTYKREPRDGQKDMRLGLDIFNEPKFLMVDQMLLQPFLDREGRFDFQHFLKKD